MIIEFADGLKTEKLYANGMELKTILGRDRNRHGKEIKSWPFDKKKLVATVKNPVAAINTYDLFCKNSELTRDNLFALFQSFPRVHEFDKSQAWWNPSIHLNVWEPTIDTYSFAHALKKEKLLKQGFESVLEIGCGTGFLGKYVFQKNKKVSRIHFTDINPFALMCAADNIDFKLGKHVPKSKLERKDAKLKVNGRQVCFSKGKAIPGKEKFDLIISNPPYVPRPNCVESNPYEGVSILKKLIVDGHKYLYDGGIIVTNYANFSSRLVNKMFEKTRMCHKTIFRKEIPQKVLPISNNKKWKAYLKKLGLREKEKRGYSQWYDLNITKLWH